MTDDLTAALRTLVSDISRSIPGLISVTIIDHLGMSEEFMCIYFIQAWIYVYTHGSICFKMLFKACARIEIKNVLPFKLNFLRKVDIECIQTTHI